MAIVMKGPEVALKIKEKIADDLAVLSKKGIVPNLATVRVGNRADSVSYEKGVIKFMKGLSIGCESFVFDEDIKKEDFFNRLKEININKGIHGILLFKPLPKALECKETSYIIDPIKDVDGSNPINMGKLIFKDKEAFAPCTAEAVVKILDYYEIPLAGKNAVVAGRSLVVGKPLSILLLDRSATVTVCHSKTKEMDKICSKADILAVALGQMEFIKKDYIKEGAIVVDVGINADENGKLKGDVLYEEAFQKASYITPVPGGVGSVTNAVLAEHTIRACKRLMGIREE